MNFHNNNYSKLQNGTDIRGVAYKTEDGPDVNFGPEEAYCIAAAFVRWLSQKTGKAATSLKIGVGHDSRITAIELKDAIIAGLGSEGADVYDGGLASTPAMFMTTVYEEFLFDGSIMITASHLPFNRNGMKFFDAGGGLDKPDITKILSLAGTEGRDKADCIGEDIEFLSSSESHTADIIDVYSRDLVEKIRCSIYKSLPIHIVSKDNTARDNTARDNTPKESTSVDNVTTNSVSVDGLPEDDNYLRPLKDMRIVVDAGNGAGGFFVEKVLKPLGADTEGSLYLEPDGLFPNHIPNPEDRAAMAAIRQAVLDNKADLGLIFDTDVDRMSAVLSDGRTVNRDAIIAMMAAILAKEYPGSTIVTDSVTSDRLTDFIEGSLGLGHHRFKRGYKNVINECRRLNSEGICSPLAIETSGHGALKENYYLDDGAYMAVKLLIAAALARREGRRLSDYIADLRPSYEEDEVRIKITATDFAAYGTQVLREFENRARQRGIEVAEPSYEGVRLRFAGKDVPNKDVSNKDVPNKDVSDKDVPDTEITDKDMPNNNKPGEDMTGKYETYNDIRGWLLLRLSLHDPLLPLNMEGEREGDVQKMKKLVSELLDGFDELDCSAIC